MKMNNRVNETSPHQQAHTPPMVCRLVVIAGIVHQVCGPKDHAKRKTKSGTTPCKVAPCKVVNSCTYSHVLSRAKHFRLSSRMRDDMALRELEVRSVRHTHLARVNSLHSKHRAVTVAKVAESRCLDTIISKEGKRGH
jgi:hypothetical protein